MNHHLRGWYPCFFPVVFVANLIIVCYKSGDRPNHPKIVHGSRKLMLCPPLILKQGHVKLSVGFRLLTWIVPDLGCHLQAVCLNAPNPFRLSAAHSYLAACVFGDLKSDWMLSQLAISWRLHGLYRHLFESLPGLCGAPSFEGWDGPCQDHNRHPQKLTISTLRKEMIGSSEKDGDDIFFRGYLKFQVVYVKIV